MKYNLILLILWSSLVQAEVWKCSDATNSIITNTPTINEKVSCLPLSTATSAYNNISAEKFSNLNQDLKTNPEKQKQATENSRPRLKSLPLVSWKAKEIIPGGGKYKKHKQLTNIFCAVTGIVKAAETSSWTIQITRGALTVDQLKVKAKKDYLESSWKVLLDGSCRNPEVKVVSASFP